MSNQVKSNGKSFVRGLSVILILLLGRVRSDAQDFKKVVDIVVGVEDNLKNMIVREEDQRKSETARLRKEIEELRGLLAHQPSVVIPDRAVSIKSIAPDISLRVETAEKHSNGVTASVQDPSPSQKNQHTEQENASDAPSKFWTSSALSGDWNGGRTWMADRGIELDGTIKADAFSNLRGGLERKAAYLRNIDITVGIDGERLVGWKGGKLFVQVLSNNGGDLSRYVGDEQVVSNIEAPSMVKLYQAWVQQDLWHGSASLLVGLYDLNSEFYVTETSGLFLNSSHGIGSEFAHTGRNGPSIFPNTSAGARFFVRPGDEFYIRAVALDGVPGTPDDPFRTSISFSKEDGILLNAEGGYCVHTGEGDNADVAKLAIGAWRYTSAFDKLNEVNENGEPVRCTDNWGMYLLAEKTLYTESGHPSHGLAAFMRVGRASSCINQFDYYFGAGVVYRGLLRGRDEDQIGIAIANAHNGAEYIQSARREGRRVTAGEVSVELTYRAQLTPWLALQPDIQYVIHPSSDAQIANALVAGSRFQISL